MTVLTPETTKAQCQRHCQHKVDREKRWDRPRINGEIYTRASTVAHTLSDQHNLIGWKARMTLLGASTAILQRAKALDPDDRDGLQALVEEAADRAGASDAADRGTVLHDHIARWARGELDRSVLDESQAASIEAFEGLLADLGLEPRLSEQFVADRRSGVAGTFDLGLQDRQGRWWLGDVKTGAKMWEQRYPLDTAIQLAAYAAGRRYCPEHGWLHTPRWHGRLLLSVPVDAGGATAAAFNPKESDKAFQKAMHVRWLRSNQRGLLLQPELIQGLAEEE